MIEYRIEHWEIVGKLADCYQSPESATMHIRGKIYGHPDFGVGEVIVTSAILEADGRHIRTAHHNYILGLPRPEYRIWYKLQHGKELDPTMPFAAKTKIKDEPSNPRLLLYYLKLVKKYGRKSDEALDFLKHHNENREFQQLVFVLHQAMKVSDKGVKEEKAALRRLLQKTDPSPN